MKIIELTQQTQKPSLYKKGSTIMWTDPHISKQLLKIHLQPDLDLASRKLSTIKSTADWVLDQTSKERMNILEE